MIKIHKYADDRFTAVICDGDEPVFDVYREMENQELYQKNQYPQPPAPYDRYGSGGYRYISNSFLVWSRSGAASSIEDAVKNLQRKTMIRGAQKRVDNAKKRLEEMEKRLEALKAEHRLFDSNTGEEIIL